MKPIIGDRVAGHLDFSIQYQGVLIEDGGLYAIVKGGVVIYNDWKGTIVEGYDRIMVPFSRLQIA